MPLGGGEDHGPGGADLPRVEDGAGRPVFARAAKQGEPADDRAGSFVVRAVAVFCCLARFSAAAAAAAASQRASWCGVRMISKLACGFNYDKAHVFFFVVCVF